MPQYILDKDQIHTGLRLEADVGFTCLKKGQIVEVKKSVNSELYVECDVGRHYLDDQIDFKDDTKIVGFLLAMTQQTSEASQ